MKAQPLEAPQRVQALELWLASAKQPYILIQLVTLICYHLEPKILNKRMPHKLKVHNCCKNILPFISTSVNSPRGSNILLISDNKGHWT